MIRELAKRLPAAQRNQPEARELASRGRGTTTHVERLLAPRPDGEDHTKGIDLSPSGVRARWQARYADTMRVIECAPWTARVGPVDGVVVHEPIA